MKKFLLCLLPTSVLCGGLEHNVGWSLLEAHAQGSSPEPIAWVIGQQQNPSFGQFCMASLMETVSDKQAENGPNFDVRIGYWLSSENILQMRLPVRPSEPLFHRIPSLIGDWLFLVGTDGSTIDTFSLSVEEQPQTAPPDKLLSITPIKLNCSEPEQLVFTPDCEIELPGDDLLINLSRADGLRVWFSTKDERTAQSISTPQSAKVIDSLNNCVAALSNDQTYKDVIKLRDTGSAGN